MSAPFWLRSRHFLIPCRQLLQAQNLLEHKTAGVLSERQPNIAKTTENPKSEEMPETIGKENAPTNLMKHINFHKVHGCSFNFSS